MNEPELTVNGELIRHNVERWRRQLGARDVWAVVKSNAYGLGAVEVARAALAGGASRLVIFDLDEARPLRDAGISAPVVHAFATPPASMRTALELDVIPSVEDAAAARALDETARAAGKTVIAHVAIDTNTGWSGVSASKAGALARDLRSLRGVDWEGAWTHIAGRASFHAQVAQFDAAVHSMRDAGLTLPALHVASTGPALWGEGPGSARIGIGLYGATLSDADNEVGLKTAVTLEAAVIALKRFEEPTQLGYSGADVAQPGETIATLRLGYADGFARTLGSGAGAVRLAGVRCPTAGAIGMNCTMVRVGNGTSVRLGDRALAVGDADGFTLDEVAKAAGTIPHALLSGLANAARVRWRQGPASELRSSALPRSRG